MSEKIGQPSIEQPIEQEPYIIGEELDVSIEELRSLSPEDQQEAVEDMAFDVLQSSPVGEMTMNLLNKARSAGDEEKANAIAHQRKRLLEEYKRQIAFMCGVTLEDEDAQKYEYQQRLRERYSKLSLQGISNEETMDQLGFFSEDKETGEKKFRYPRDIFPPSINEKWDRYVESVQSHLRAYSEVKHGITNNPEKVAEWDQIRRIMHNGLAKEINDFLDLGWDEERSRKFVTKMLEKRIPTKDTRESILTTQAILGPLQKEERITKVIKQRHHDSE